MKLAKHDLVAALSLRYDHHSAQGLFEAACKRADLADQDHYTAADVAAFRAALARLGDRLQRVDERLDSLLGTEAVANLPQSTAPMPATTDPEAARQAAAPMVAVTETPKPASEPAKPAQAATAPVPAKPEPEAAKPGRFPQAAAPMTAEPAKPVATASTEDDRPATRIVLTGIEDLEDGERLFVCGDRNELGSWDPDRARPLHFDGEVWSTSIAPGDGTFKFLRRSVDGTITWEGGENREIGAAIEIETSWHV